CPRNSQYRISGTQVPDTEFLEDIFQCELHNSRILRREHLAKSVAIQIRRWIVHLEAVRHVESLSTKLHSLAFTHLKGSGEGYVELPRAWPDNAAGADISKRSECGRIECCGTKIVADGFVSVGIDTVLINVLYVGTVQRPVLIYRLQHV